MHSAKAPLDLQPLSLSLRFSPSCSLFPYPHPYPARVLAIRHTNDWVLKICISGSLTLCSTRGTVQISWDSAFLEVSVTVQLHRYTHEIINILSARKLFSVVLAIRHTNDCVSNPGISGTLRSVRPGGLYRYLWIVRFLEVSVTVRLHGFTHKIINTLSVSKLFPALLAVYLLL